MTDKEKLEKIQEICEKAMQDYKKATKIGTAWGFEVADEIVEERIDKILEIIK